MCFELDLKVLISNASIVIMKTSGFRYYDLLWSSHSGEYIKVNEILYLSLYYFHLYSRHTHTDILIHSLTHRNTSVKMNADERNQRKKYVLFISKK